MAKSQYTHDVVATTGEYTNQSGEKKKEYTNVGKAFTDDQGRISIKMKTIPVGPEWSGWLSLYPAKEREPQGAPQRPIQRSMPPAPVSAEFHEDDDIPF
jgi:hypothetical protein